MSNDDALIALTHELRSHLDAKPRAATAEAVVRSGQWWSEQRRRLRAAQPFLVGGGLILFGIELLFAWLVVEAGADRLRFDLHVGLLMMCLAPFAFAGVAWRLAHKPRFWAQLTARAMFWGLGLLIVALQSSTMRGYVVAREGVLVAVVSASATLCTIACVAVLLKLGDHGLRLPQRTAFEPVAHRRLLTLSLVMGLADAVILAIVGLTSLSDPGFDSAVRLGLASLLGISAWGLSRLRVWGLGAMAVGNLLEVFAVGTGALDSIGPLVFVLVATAAVQLVLPVPVYSAMLRPASAPQAPSRLWRRLPRVVLLGAAALSFAEFVYTVALLVG